MSQKENDYALNREKIDPYDIWSNYGGGDVSTYFNCGGPNNKNDEIQRVILRRSGNNKIRNTLSCDRAAQSNQCPGCPLVGIPNTNILPLHNSVV